MAYAAPPSISGPTTDPSYFPNPLPVPQVDDLNRERKLQQSAAGGELSKLEAEYLGLVHKNGEIEAVCRGLEAEVAAMREALPRQEGQQQQQDGEQQQGEQQQQQNGVEGVGEVEEEEGMES